MWLCRNLPYLQRFGSILYKLAESNHLYGKFLALQLRFELRCYMSPAGTCMCSHTENEIMRLHAPCDVRKVCFSVASSRCDRQPDCFCCALHRGFRVEANIT